MSQPTPPRPPASSGKRTKDAADRDAERTERPDQPAQGKGAETPAAAGARKRAGAGNPGSGGPAPREDATQRLDAGARSDRPPVTRPPAREKASGGVEEGRRTAVAAPSSARTRPVPSSSTAGAPSRTTAAPPPPVAPVPSSGRLVRRRAVLRKLDPWSVLKLSLIFYFCALLIVMLALAVFWAIINQLGLVDRLLDFLAELQVIVEIRAGMIARAIFLLGLLNVVLWSGINVFLAFLYNLIADLVGGLKMTLVEEA